MLKPSLMVKLTVALLFTALIGVGVVAYAARQVTAREFDQFITQEVIANFADFAQGYYALNDTWYGLAAAMSGNSFRNPVNVPTLESLDLPPRPRDKDNNNGDDDDDVLPELRGPLPENAPFVLADRRGRVVLPGGPYQQGDVIPRNRLGDGIALYDEDERIGTVITLAQVEPSLTARELNFIDRTNQALLIAGVGASAVAIVVGILLAQLITNPIRGLTGAIRAMQDGELKQAVPVTTQDEIGELITAFNEMSANVARANQLRRQMTADIAHDLRTPLTVITGYLEGLRDGVIKPSYKRFDTMYNEALHLQHLIDDLRTLTLADAGILTLNKQPVDVQTWLLHLAESVEAIATPAGIAIGIDAPDDLPKAIIDRDRMTQVMTNLMSNALRFTHEGGYIRLCAARDGEWLRLAVEDNGIGIAPEKLPHIFERFYRVDESRNVSEQGESGLGLAIVQSIVKAHGGHVKATSSLGEGTTIWVWVPLKQPL